MARRSSSIPVGRIRRGAKVGGLLGRETARVYATKAANLTFRDMQKAIERELGERIFDVFCELDRDAAAAASIGQVYRARLHDGRRVAVKVQYPGVAAAVRADLQNLGRAAAANGRGPGCDRWAGTR